MLKFSKISNLVLILLVLPIAAGCAVATPAPTPTPVPPTSTSTPLPGVEAAINVSGVDVKVVEVSFGKYLGSFGVVQNEQDLPEVGVNITAEEGSRFAEVVIQVIEGDTPENVMGWEISLQDSQGKTYKGLNKGWGVFYGDKDNVGVSFHIPESENQLTLLLPGEISIDISSLIKK